MKVLEHQLWHLLSLIILLGGIYFLTKENTSFFDGSYLGLKNSSWFIIAILSPIVHQVYVLVCWRLELYYQSISKVFGSFGFLIYKVLFTILIISRLVSILILAIASSKTLEINTILSYLISIIFVILAGYLFYSVKFYFGFDRAFGVDHFQPEELSQVPFVKQGIFKYTNNGMYIFGFLILWVPGLLLFSKPAILAAIFNHLYIWVHYYFTELPDIKYIYKS